MKKQLDAMKRACAQNPITLFLLFVTKIVVTSIAVYVSIGALFYPDWWRLVIWGGGLLDSRLWDLGWLTITRAAREFWPYGFLAIAAAAILCGVILYKWGRHGRDFWCGAFRAMFPSTRVCAIAVLICAATCFALLPRKPQGYDSLWNALEFERQAQNLIAIWTSASAKENTSEYDPPRDGVYLYLNDKLVVRQFEALMPSLRVTGSKERSSIGGDVSVRTGAKAGGLEVRSSSSRETEILKEAPRISAPYAAQQLIPRLKESDDTVKVGAVTSQSSAQAVRLIDQLKRGGVHLTDEQIAKLEAADRERYLREVLKADRVKVLMYWGPIELRKAGEDVVVGFTENGPIRVSGQGRLNADGLGDHLNLGLRINAPIVRLGAAALYGLIETRSLASNSVDLVFTPYAIW
jgi:hypothetical protein